MHRLFQNARFLVPLILLLSSCRAFDSGSRSAASLTDLRSLDEFEEAFNQGKGTPRLVLLLSPT